MSKIVQAVNAMISNREQISNVRKKGDEYFFLYKNKYKWSIAYSDERDDYTLYFYPGNQSLDELVSMPNNDWQYFKEFIFYSGQDLGTKEAQNTFKEIYMIVKEKVLGVDKVLDEIIGDDVAF